MTADAGERYAGLTPGRVPRSGWSRTSRAQGLLRGEEPYTHTVPFSHRSGARVEPLVSLQWFCDMTRLAAPAIAAVEEGRVRFTPAKWGEVYLDWMREIRPWCISRQLWWGHQIPVWYRGEEVYVGREAPEGEGWERDPDVLDTWFSSALWPFATLGLARADPRARALLPHPGALDRPRHHLPLGRPHGDDGLRVHGRGALRRGLHPLGRPGARRAAHEQVARHRHRPDGA